MTKSISKLKIGGKDVIIIELRKHGIDSIMLDGEVSVGEYDGVDFVKKDASEEKMKIAKDYSSKMKELLSSCACIISIVYSDMLYVKFYYNSTDVIAFISQNGYTTYNKQIPIDKSIEDKIKDCAMRFLDILGVKL
ncbi:hypothetical protein [Acidianus sp. HS-5]|uniref:hypothetical protein n=1 Tax=Acidianus sp. HS-5 TaxID=2886040 RepID=UPI001F1A42CC|nr:hypothetical protein [Acidianus sp. HS-5]BDC19163.1 hypothetical protein HS5_20530 [Acidianus sp. HS-5]